MPKITLPRTGTGDPLLGLVEDRFRLLRHYPACDDQNEEEVFDRRLDEIKRRIRRLDEASFEPWRPRRRAFSLSSACLLSSMKKAPAVLVGEALY